MNAATPLYAAPSSLVAHPQWAAARAGLLRRIANGAGTVALLGEAGTGKTWLLRALTRELGQAGGRVKLLRQGDTPFELTPGEILLIDEAARMDDASLAAVLAQRSGIVILAELPCLASRLDAAVPVISLERLDPAGMVEFVAGWMRAAGPRAVPLTPAALERLALHADGTPRLLAQLLNATAALASGHPGSIGVADVDDAAAFRLGGIAVEPAAPAPRPIERPVIRRIGRRRIAALAVAAGIVAAWMAIEPGTDARTVRTEAIVAAEPVPAALAPRLPPQRGEMSFPTPGRATLPPRAALAPAASASVPAVASAAPAPTIIAARLAPPRALLPAIGPASGITPPLEAARRAHEQQGLIVMARQGDTLQALYTSIYQGVRAPPYMEVASLNPQPMRPGGIVVFPTPPEGWSQP